MDHGAGNKAANAIRPTTDIDTINETLALANSVASRVEATVDSLLGAMPTASVGGATAGTVQPDGVIPAMAACASHTRNRLGDAMSALERLQRALA